MFIIDPKKKKKRKKNGFEGYLSDAIFRLHEFFSASPCVTFQQRYRCTFMLGFSTVFYSAIGR